MRFAASHDEQSIWRCQFSTNIDAELREALALKKPVGATRLEQRKKIAPKMMPGSAAVNIAIVSCHGIARRKTQTGVTLEIPIATAAIGVVSLTPSTAASPNISNRPPAKSSTLWNTAEL